MIGFTSLITITHFLEKKGADFRLQLRELGSDRSRFSPALDLRSIKMKKPHIKTNINKQKGIIVGADTSPTQASVIIEKADLNRQ